jgi:predicted small lipoprotein YifL
MRHLPVIAALAAALLQLGGCGQTGPLYLPQEPGEPPVVVEQPPVLTTEPGVNPGPGPVTESDTE